MARPSIGPLVRRLVTVEAAGALTDADLLERFAIRRDEAAFEVLVWRHGPMVLNACRRLLGHEQDAEDAFQATFLALARRARSVARREALAGWLYRVACRVALKARARAAKRGQPESVAADALAAPPVRVPDTDLRPVLDEELSRLPSRYRLPVVLCYLQGKTNAEAARELGCPPGTVASRLAWARVRLRGRLARRGLAPSAALLSGGRLADGGTLSAGLVAATVRMGCVYAVAGGAVGAVPAHLAAWAEGAVRAMLVTKLKIVGAVVLAVGLLGTGASLLPLPGGGRVERERSGRRWPRPRRRARPPTRRRKPTGNWRRPNSGCVSRKPNSPE